MRIVLNFLLILVVLLVSSCAPTDSIEKITPQENLPVVKSSEVVPEIQIETKPTIFNQDTILINQVENLTMQEAFQIAQEYADEYQKINPDLEYTEVSVINDTVGYLPEINTWTASIRVIYSVDGKKENSRKGFRIILYIDTEGEIISDDSKIQDTEIFSCSNKMTDNCRGAKIYFEYSLTPKEGITDFDEILKEVHNATEIGGYRSINNAKLYFIAPEELIPISRYDWVNHIGINYLGYNDD